MEKCTYSKCKLTGIKKYPELPAILCMAHGTLYTESEDMTDVILRQEIWANCRGGEKKSKTMNKVGK